MEATPYTEDTYKCLPQERVWQRAGSSLVPYPAERLPMAPLSAGTAAETPGALLPGAQPDPCCMGTAAGEMLDVLMGFIEETRGDLRYYRAMLRCAPQWAGKALRELMREKEENICCLEAAYFLITGRPCRSSAGGETLYIGPWRSALRERYHAESCGWMNYLRAADSTTDPCLADIFTQLGRADRRHADRLMKLLERSLC